MEKSWENYLKRMAEEKSQIVHKLHHFLKTSELYCKTFAHMDAISTTSTGSPRA